MVEEIKQLKAKNERQRKHIQELERAIEKYKKQNEFLNNQLSCNLDKYYKVRIAQEEALSLMNDIEELKNELKAVQYGEIKHG